MKQPDLFISIIIPTRNEEKYISKCLQSLVDQTYRKDKFEVLIIDGMSEDATLNIAKNFENKLNLKILYNSKVKQVFALNLGIKEARGNYIIFLSGHSFVERDFIAKNVDLFLRIKVIEPKLVAVGGNVEIIHEKPLAKLFSSIYRSPFSGGSSFWFSKNPHFANTVAFGFYDKKTVEEVGLLDEDMISGEDFELNMRLVKKGYRIYYSPEIKAYYYSRSSFLGFLRQSFNYGAAKGLCIRKGYFKSIWLVPLLFIIYEMLLVYLFFMQTSLITLITYSIPFIAYWIINSLVSLRVCKNNCILLLPIMFWIFHNIIGFGLTAGIFLGKRVFNLRNRKLSMFPLT